MWRDAQNRTALANTPGSLFFKECEEAFAKGDFLTILNRFVEQADVLFTKIPDKGEQYLSDSSQRRNALTSECKAQVFVR